MVNVKYVLIKNRGLPDGRSINLNIVQIPEVRKRTDLSDLYWKAV